MGTAATVIALAGSASAEEEPRSAETIEAERLFASGRRLLKQGDLEEACHAFDASYGHLSTLGTLLNRADCYERTGRLADAWRAFDEATAWAERTNEARRRDVARQRAQSLKTRVSWMRVSAPEGTQVSVDGEPLGDPSPDAIPVDPGAHLVAAALAGKQAWTRKVEVSAEPKWIPVEVPSLASADAPKVDLAPPPALPAPAPAPAPLPPAPTIHAALPATRSPPRPVASVDAARPSRSAAAALTTGGAVLLAAGVAGIAYSMSLEQASLHPAPGAPSQYPSVSVIYPLSLATAVVGATTCGFGIFMFAKGGSPSGGASGGMTVGGRF